MSSTLKSERFLIVFLIFLVYPALHVLGQGEVTYEGPLKVLGYSGEAKYDYALVDSDTIINGSFEFQRSNLSALIADQDVSFVFKGAFIDNYPDGPWQFQFGEFQSNSSSKIVDYQYRVSVSGIQETAIGAINKGKPDGPWVYAVHQIKDSEVQDTLFRSSFEFDSGVPLRSFRIENEENILVGRFLRNGFAHDEWALFSPDKIENSQTWYFTDGRLTKIQLQDAGEQKLTNVFDTDFQEFKTIDLDQRFLDILQLWSHSSDSTVLKKGIPGLLSENAAYYQKLDEILSHLGESSFRPELKVKVPYHPLDSLAMGRMAAIKDLYKKSWAISDSLLNGTQLNILKRSDDEALFLYNALDGISKKFLYPLGKIVSYDEENILQYIPFKRLVGETWPNGFPSKEIKINRKGAGPTNFVGPKASQYNFSENTIAAVQQLAEYAKGSVDSVQALLRPKLAGMKRRQEFIALEKQMISHIKGLNAVIDSVGNKFPSEMVRVLEQMKMIADSGLSKYSKMEGLNAKLEYGNGLVECFTHFEELEQVILELPKKKEEIKKTYEDQVWNPFMANLMTEELKKRLTSAYRKVLLPYFLSEATAGLNCDNADTLVKQFGSTHQRMLEMRDADTKKLERKLKRERNPKVIMQLFQIEPLGKVEE